MDSDEYYISVALQEAAKGLGRTSPNPCVGAVIVREGRIVATGYHKKAGMPHAERNAIAAAQEPLAGATIYVTLEPCSHSGRTPPCCDAIIEHRFARVVIGMEDPNPLVNGSGIDRLRQAGIEVRCGVLAEECRRLNRPFIKYITTGRPWTIMKAGVSLDGRLNYQPGKGGWITGPASLQRVHQLRDQVDAIMVGSGTVVVDNPALTTRLDEKKGRDALRVVLDSTLRTPLDAKIYTLNSAAQTIVFCGEDVALQRQRALASSRVVVIPLPLQHGIIPLDMVLDRLGERGVCSLLVEGGGRLHGAMMEKRLYDEAALFYAPLFAGTEGVALTGTFPVTDRSAAPYLQDRVVEQLGDDWLVRGLFAK